MGGRDACRALWADVTRMRLFGHTCTHAGLWSKRDACRPLWLDKNIFLTLNADESGLWTRLLYSITVNQYAYIESHKLVEHTQ